MSILLALTLAAPPSEAGDPAVDAVTQAVLQDMKIDTRVRLVDPGKGPRTPIRYAPRPGTTANYEIRSKTAMDMTIQMPDGQEMSLPMGDMMPVTVATMRHTVGEPLQNGIVPVRVEQVDVRLEGAPPELAGAMEQGLAQTRGLAFRVLVDPATGRPVQLDVEKADVPAIGEAVQNLADQMVTQLSAFPQDPVAPGAKWVTEMDMAVAGMTMHATQTSTVTAVTADTVDFDVTATLTMAEGAIRIPGMPPGAQVDVVRFSGSGSGRMHIDCATLVNSGTMEMKVDMAMKMTPPGQPPMTMDMKMSQATETRLKK